MQEAPAHTDKKKKGPPKVKGVSKILAALDGPPPGLGNQQGANEPGEEAATGRQRGAKNYTNDELRLLITCVEHSVGIPNGFKGAAGVYNRIAGENGWATRGVNPLSQRWEKVVGLLCTCIAEC